MALSNWDTFAVDQDGKPCSGTFNSPLGVQVAFYKNWLYVRDEVAWQEGGSYVKPTVMEIQEGSFKYKDIRVFAKRGPQNGIYAAITSTKYPPNEMFVAMVGIGCYGYGGPQDEDGYEGWLGVLPESVDYLRKVIDEALEEFAISPRVKDISLDNGTRFNQGDAYFSAHLGSETPATKPGEAGETIMSKIINTMKEKK